MGSWIRLDMTQTVPTGHQTQELIVVRPTVPPTYTSVRKYFLREFKLLS